MSINGNIMLLQVPACHMSGVKQVFTF